MLALIAGRHRFVLPLLAMTAASSLASAAETVQLSMEAHRGYFAERCIELSKGTKFAYEIRTPYTIDFNLHHHPASGPAVFPERLTFSSRHANEIAIESSGTYCFMATNPEDRPEPYVVTVTYDVTGG